MRRALIGIGAVGAACAAGAVIAVLVGLDLMVRSRLFGDGTVTEADIDRAQSVAQLGYAIAQLIAPLLGGVLLAAIAILVLLAIRWRAPSA